MKISNEHKFNHQLNEVVDSMIKNNKEFMNKIKEIIKLDGGTSTKTNQDKIKPILIERNYNSINNLNNSISATRASKNDVSEIEICTNKSKVRSHSIIHIINERLSN